MTKKAIIVTALSLMLIPALSLGSSAKLATDIERELRATVLNQDSEYMITLPAFVSTLPSEYDSIKVEPLGDSQMLGSCLVKTYFFRGGTVLQATNLNVQINLYRQVLVAQTTIKKDESLVADQFAFSRRDVTTLTDPPILSTGELTGTRAVRPISQGKMLTQSLIAKEDLIKRGDRVTIEYSSGSFKVTAAGEATQPGSRGDLIRVKNISSNKIVSAEVQNEQSVKVVR